MSRWWRAYDEAVDDPKLLLLSDRAHRAWFNLMCLASLGNGLLPQMKVIELKLRLPPAKTQAVLEELTEAGLIDVNETGEMRPHNWNGRQYKSDVSTERVKRFRNGKRNVSVTPPEDRVQNTDTESKKDSWSVANATRPKVNEFFEEFWAVYPKRKGPNPKAPARKLFEAAVKAGTDPQAIIAGARRYAADERERIGTEFIPHARKWLHGRCWEDYQADVAPAGTISDEEREKLFALLREDPDVGRQNLGEGTSLRPTGVGVCENEKIGGQGRARSADHRARKSGMVSLASVLRRPSALPAGGDDADREGAGQQDDSADAMARRF